MKLKIKLGLFALLLVGVLLAATKGPVITERTLFVSKA
jgi:hypothetical protein